MTSKLVQKYAKLANDDPTSLSVIMGEITNPQIQQMAEQYGMTLMELEQDEVSGGYYLPGNIPAQTITYTEQRQQAYPQLTEQLDMLYHDIDQGKLGETAQNSSFYLALKQVKETYPKAEDEVEETEEVKEPIGV